MATTLLFVAKTGNAALFTDNTSNPSYYFLWNTTPLPTDSITVEQAWNTAGAFIFTKTAISNPSQFIPGFQSFLAKLQGSDRFIAWVLDPEDINSSMLDNKNVIPMVAGTANNQNVVQYADGGNATFGNMRLGFPQKTILNLQTEGDNPKVVATVGDEGFSFKIGWAIQSDNSTTISVTPDGISINLGGSNNGQCLFATQPNEANFYQLFANTDKTSEAPASAEMRYTYGASDQVASLRYPIFTGVSPILPSNKFKLDLLGAVDPLQATNSSRTYFDFNFDNQPNESIFTVPTTRFFSNTYGTPLTLTPKNNSGFALGLRPATTDTSTDYLYLLPKGQFQVTESESSSNLIQVLCGTNSTEFLLIASGDFVNFSTDNSPGSAPNFSTSSGNAVDQVNLLTDASSSAYLGIIPGANQGTAFANTPFKESYCVQSEGLIFYHEVSGAYYAAVIGCRLADLSTAGSQPPFPMVPYGGIYKTIPEQGFQNPNRTVQGTVFEDFETSVIRPNRRDLIQPDMCLGPLFFDLLSPTLAPITGYVLTAEGLLVKLNDGSQAQTPAGTWGEIILAKSPINPDQYISIGSCDNCGDCGNDPQYEVVNPHLSNALMSNAPMIVITQDQFGGINGQSAFANELQMDEFTFEINLDRNDSLGDGDSPTILLFKLDTGLSVKDLSQMPSLWGYPEYFISENQDTINAISQDIYNTIEEAENTTGKQRVWFEDFIQKMTDPTWTGVIALNCSLDYQALPIDIQMLLGGIEGQLMAHHFGVTDNNIENNFSGNEIPIENSSLFALIYYNHPQPTAYNDGLNHFETLILNALFKNSVMTNFQSRIAMTIPKLFEETASLTQYQPKNGNWVEVPPAIPGQNIIEIDGVYQAPKDPNGIGKVVFESEDHFVFSFPSSQLRVLDNVVVTDASLVPITEVATNDCQTQVTSYFELIGGIGFTDSIGKDPNNNNGNIDAFSFAANVAFTEKGLGLRGYNFDITTCINGNTATLIDGIPTLYDEIQTFIQKTGTSTQARDGSLYATFPLELVQFMYNLDGGLTPEALQGKTMVGIGTDKINVGSSSEYPPVLSDVNPNFGFQFKMNVGSLGGLVSDDSILNAEVVLGWTISGSTTNDDKPNKVAMIFQPPDGISLDGSFKIEGVFNSVYGDVVLDRYPYNSDNANSPLLFVITLMDVNFDLLSLQLLPKYYGLTLFGNPILGANGNPQASNSNNLTWFTGNPIHSSDPGKPDYSNLDVSFIYQPLMGLMSALEINTAATGELTINVIGPTITKLIQLPIITEDFIDDISSGTESIVNYNPNSKILLWFDMTFAAINIQGIFNDPSFYGGLVKIGPPKKDNGGDNGGNGNGGNNSSDANLPAATENDDGGNGNDDKKTGIMDVLGGLEIVFVYRKISDTLGVYAVQLVLPDKFRKFTIGGFGFELPSVGLEIFTNGDFKVEIGWPFGSTNSFAPAGTQFKVTVPIYPPPLQIEFFAGFYFAKLRSEDAPGVFAGSDFSLIYMFGIGVGVGLGVTKDWAVISFSATLSIWTTMEGLLASEKGVITNDGIDYYWFAGQVGITLNLQGKVNLGIISASLEFEATLVLGLAIERYHKSYLEAQFQIKIEFKVKVTFFTIKFRFSFQLTLFTFSLGPSGAPNAELSGPTPPFSPTEISNTAKVERSAALFEEAQLVEPAEAPTDQVTLNVYFTMQPTAVYNSDQKAFLSNAVASMVITLDNFTALVQQIMPYLVSQYGGSTLTDQMNNIINNISAIEADALNIMQALFNVNVAAGSSVSQDTEVGIFALPPGLEMVYNGNTINFDETQASADYLQVVQDYFNQLQEVAYVNPNAAAADTVPITEVLFENYIGLIVQGTAQTIVSNIQNGATYTSLTDALDPNNFSYDSLSGSVSRYLQTGLQLPVPSNTSKLAPMYMLTNQQTEVAFDKDNNPVLEFDLKTQADAPSWLSLDLADGQDSLMEMMDSSLVFKAPTVSDDWINNAAPLAPILPFTNLFQLTTSQEWSDANSQTWNLRPFSDSLSQYLSNAAQGDAVSLTLKQTAAANSDSSDLSSLTTIPATPALFVKFKLRQIPKSTSTAGANASGSNLENVYEVVGTDDTTRDLIQEVLDVNDLSSISSINLLTSSSDSDYSTGSTYSSGLMVRTNLSTDSEAPESASFAELMTTDGLSATSDLGPLQATLQTQDALKFLRLLWECSIVNTQGFYLQIDNLDQSIFGSSGEAGVALLVEFTNSGTNDEVALAYPNYYNLLVLDDAQKGNSVAAYLQDSAGDIQVVYQPNINAGSTGFTVNTITAETPSVQSDPGDYLDYIYQFLQYKVDGVSGESNFQPTNWSVPNGATSEPADNNQLQWNFRQSIPVYHILGMSNPYAAVGKIVQISVRMLDMFGNALPNQWSESLTVEYNDAIIPPGQWPGVGTNYLIEDNNGQPQLSLNFAYQPGDIKQNNQSQDGTPSQLQQAIAKFTMVKNQLDDPNVTVSLSTVLASGTFTQDSQNQDLAAQLSTFVSQILSYLQTDNATAPSGVTYTFQLDKSYVGNLNSDIIQLEVNLTIGRDPSKVETSISDLFNEVLSVTNPISAYVADSSENGDQSGVVPFAQSFEAAYLNFGGANTWVKIAQGPKMPTATGDTTRALFAVRWGENAGIHVEFPNTGNRPTDTQQPVYFAPTPLSTILLNGTFNHLYQYDSNGTNPTSVKRAFSNVDLDQWGRFFLNQLHLMLSPPLATAIAKINANIYQSFIDTKESLAGTITGEVASILEYTSFTPDGSAASDAFEQALLSSLNKDYATSSVIQVPATVSTKGNVSSPPPQLFGKVAENNNNDGQIYTLSSGRLDAANETEQFAFLASAKRPETDAFLNFNDLNFNIGFIQYMFEEDEAQFGFVPSTWLTFVLPEGAPLQQALGPIEAPVPLRSFPASPVLLSQKQNKSKTAATTITDSLLWTYDLQMGIPEAEQDQLYFNINFNVPVTQQSITAEALAKTASGRPAPSSLFEALARFIYEYPQLAQHLANIVDVANGSGDPTNADTVLQELVELIEGVKTTWKTWQNPASAQLDEAKRLAAQLPDVITWSYSLINQSSGATIELSRASADLPWPEIAGYTGARVSDNALERNYTPTGTNQSPKSLTFSFDGLYILTHQSVNVEAYIKRNDDLVPSNAPAGTTVNNAFVYVTESVTFPSVLVPLNVNDSAIAVEDQGSLSATLEALFDNFIANPNNPQEQLEELRFSLYAESSFTLAKNSDMSGNNTVDAGAPILYSGETVATPNNTSGTPSLGMNDYIDNHLAPAIQDWENQIPKDSSPETIFLAMTIYSNVSTTQLPLVIYSELDLPTE